MYLGPGAGLSVVLLHHGDPVPGVHGDEGGRPGQALYCTVLYFGILYCTVLYCGVLYLVWYPSSGTDTRTLLSASPYLANGPGLPASTSTRGIAVLRN